MTKAQRRAKARRSGAKRRKANAARAFLRKLNPGVAKKAVGAVLRKLKGGGYSVLPIVPKKRNAGRGSLRKLKKSTKRMWGTTGGTAYEYLHERKKARRRSR